MLSRIQFDVLSTLATSKGKLTQRQLEESTQHSLGAINKAMKELSQSGFVDNGAITSSGLDALEPYRAKRAVFIAAGFGSRLVPVTLNTPKPLVRVNGKRIIDGLIEACLDAGISEIYIVRGYLAEQFDQLLYKYPMLKFLENPAYNEANNISSAMVARYLLQRLPENSLRLEVTVIWRHIYEIDAVVYGCEHRFNGFVLTYLAEHATQRRGSKRDIGHLHAGFS